MASGPQNTLRGWKEIATYVGRDVRTVQRWEARRGFPVSRLPGGERGNVYALASEVDQWLHPSARAQPFDALSASLADIASNAPLLDDLPEDADLSEASAAEPNFEAVQSGPLVAFSSFGPGVGRHGLRFTAWAAVLAVTVLVLLRFHQERVQARGTPNRALEAVRSMASSATASNADVDQLYLQGMYLFEKRTPDSLTEAKKTLLNVTAKAPNDALAWSGLAQVATLLYEYGVESAPGAPARARTSALHALALDPGLAEPHAVLGFADFFWDHNVKAAEPEFQKALRINPSSALARSWYGTFLTYEARYPEALEQLNRAQLLDPSSTAILSNRARALGLSGNRQMGIKLLENAGGDNSIANVRYNLAVLSLVRPCNADVFLREELALAAMSHADGMYHVYAAAQEAFRRGGEPAMWRSIVASGERGEAGTDLLAAAHAALGENDAAVELLAKAQRESGPIMDLSMHPLFLPLHRDPRFRRMLSAQGLPPVS